MNRQTVKGYQKTYINDQIWISTFSGGFQRAKIYKPNTEDKWRAGLRVFIKSKIEESLASSYQIKTPSMSDSGQSLQAVRLTSVLFRQTSLRKAHILSHCVFSSYIRSIRLARLFIDPSFIKEI